MSKIKTMGASPLTGVIYQGTLDTSKGRWIGNKTDVTDMACQAVAEHLKVTGSVISYGLQSGGYLILRAEVVDSLPEEFAEAKGGSS